MGFVADGAEDRFGDIATRNSTLPVVDQEPQRFDRRELVPIVLEIFLLQLSLLRFVLLCVLVVKAVHFNDKVQLRYEKINACKISNHLLLPQSDRELKVFFKDLLEVLAYHLADFGRVPVLVIRVVSHQRFQSVGLESFDPLLHLGGECWLVFNDFEIVDNYKVTINLDYAVVHSPAFILDLCVELLRVS